MVANERKKILVASSDPRKIAFFRSLFRSEEYGIIVASKSNEIARRLLQSDISIVFLDTNLEDMNDAKLVPVIKELNVKVPIVLMTTYNSKDQEKRARQLGIFYYLVEPYIEEEVKELIEKGTAIHPSSSTQTSISKGIFSPQKSNLDRGDEFFKCGY